MLPLGSCLLVYRWRQFTGCKQHYHLKACVKFVCYGREGARWVPSYRQQCHFDPGCFDHCLEALGHRYATPDGCLRHRFTHWQLLCACIRTLARRSLGLALVLPPGTLHLLLGSAWPVPHGLASKCVKSSLPSTY